MIIPRQCRQALSRLGYSFGDDIALTFENTARLYAGRSGAVLIRPGKCSVQVCGYQRRSGEVLLMTATKRSRDDVKKHNKLLIYGRRDARVYRHRGAASETLYVYLPGDPGPWVFCTAYRQADEVNLAQMILVIDAPSTPRRRRAAI